jgi:hypothetical protein
MCHAVATTSEEMDRSMRRTARKTLRHLEEAQASDTPLDIFFENLHLQVLIRDVLSSKTFQDLSVRTCL